MFLLSKKHFYHLKSFGRFSGFLDRDVEHIFVLILICVREPKHRVATPQVAQANGETTSYVCPQKVVYQREISPRFFK